LSQFGFADGRWSGFPWVQRIQLQQRDTDALDLATAKAARHLSILCRDHRSRLQLGAYWRRWAVRCTDHEREQEQEQDGNRLNVIAGMFMPILEGKLGNARFIELT